MVRGGQQGTILQLERLGEPIQYRLQATFALQGRRLATLPIIPVNHQRQTLWWLRHRRVAILDGVRGAT